MVDISVLETAINEIEKNAKILENSKFEKTQKLLNNGRQVKLTLSNEDLKNLFNLEKIDSVEKFTSSEKFTKNQLVKIIEFNGGFVVLK